MLIDYDIKGYKNQGLRDNLESLIATALLDYKHQFMRNLHVIDSRSLTRVFYLDLIS